MPITWELETDKLGVLRVSGKLSIVGLKQAQIQSLRFLEIALPPQAIGRRQDVCGPLRHRPNRAGRQCAAPQQGKQEQPATDHTAESTCAG